MISGKKVAIFGLGTEGLSAAKYLEETNDLILVDEKDEKELGADVIQFLEKSNHQKMLGSAPKIIQADFVLRSPGIKPTHPLLQSAKSAGAIITTPTQIFIDSCPSTIIGVTGTKGKGTTSTLIYEMLKSQFTSVFLGGNIGVAPLNIIKDITPASIVVLELSSFQLIDLKSSPHIAVILMVTSEHLDWHSNHKQYLNAKANIVKFQKNSDFTVINGDFENSKQIANKSWAKKVYFSTKEKTNGAYCENKDVFYDKLSPKKIFSTSDIALVGPHNVQNAIAAATVAKICKITSTNIVKTLSTFRGLKHHLETVDVISGVTFINDSFSTTPETAIAAINSYDGQKILILGGSSKQSDFSKLAQNIISSNSTKALILIGDEANIIQKALFEAGEFKGKIERGAKTMQEVIRIARTISTKGDFVILSPACASFGMFKNYKDRGNQFENEVKKLNENNIE